MRRFMSFDVLILAVGIAIGLLLPHLFALIQFEPDEFLQNLVPEAVGIVFTIVILDRLNARRAENQQVEQLIRRAKSRNNDVACGAIEELRVMGKLEDGTLCGRDFRGADWRNANLYKANLAGCDLTNVKLRGADLIHAVLTGAKISHSQLLYIFKLRYARMVDGTLYDGRYNLQGDLELAKEEGRKLESPEEMAIFYRLSTATLYTEGQSWVRANLPPSQWRQVGYDDAEATGNDERYDPSNEPT